MFKNAGKAHKRFFDKIIDELAEEVTLRFPPDKTTASATPDKIFGRTGFESTTDDSKNTVLLAVVSGPAAMGNIQFSQQSSSVNMIGMLYESDLVLRIKFDDDLLLDGNKDFGRTLFDSCRDVLVRNQAFKVKGVLRAGFPPLGPYGLYIGLVLAGE